METFRPMTAHEVQNQYDEILDQLSNAGVLAHIPDLLEHYRSATDPVSAVVDYLISECDAIDIYDDSDIDDRHRHNTLQSVLTDLVERLLSPQP